MKYNLKMKLLRKINNHQFKKQTQMIVIIIKKTEVLKLKKPIMMVKLNKQFHKIMNKYNTK
jgi:hypothetical protein